MVHTCITCMPYRNVVNYITTCICLETGTNTSLTYIANKSKTFYRQNKLNGSDYVTSAPLLNYVD